MLHKCHNVPIEECQISSGWRRRTARQVSGGDNARGATTDGAADGAYSPMRTNEAGKRAHARPRGVTGQEGPVSILRIGSSLGGCPEQHACQLLFLAASEIPEIPILRGEQGNDGAHRLVDSARWNQDRGTHELKVYPPPQAKG